MKQNKVADTAMGIIVMIVELVHDEHLSNHEKLVALEYLKQSWEGTKPDEMD